jgi:acetate kinase
VLEHQWGLEGLSGTSGDLRDVPAARENVEVAREVRRLVG